jgi:hypothetical protein
VSTSDVIDPAWRGPAWKLSAGAIFPDELVVINDGPNHWAWEPSRNMPLVEFVEALEKVDDQFQKV